MRFDRMELGLTNPTDWKKHWSWPKWKQKRRRERMRLQHHICARAPSFSWTQHKKWQISRCGKSWAVVSMISIQKLCILLYSARRAHEVQTALRLHWLQQVRMPVACFYQVYNLICSSQNHISNQVLVLKNVFATECTKSETQSWLWTCLRWHLRWHLMTFKMTIDDMCTTFVLRLYSMCSDRLHGQTETP